MSKEKLNFGFKTARNLLILWGVLNVANAYNSDHYSENDNDKKDSKIENSITGTQEKIVSDLAKEIYYRVQVAAYRHPGNYNNDRLTNMGKLQTTDIDKITRFTIGTFSTLKETRQFKEKIVNRGTKDAFIIAVENGERKYLYQLSSFKYPEPSKKEVVADKEWTQNGISEYATPLGEFVYKVQVIDIDKTTRLTVGTFGTLEEAMWFKKKIVHRGTKDVSITAKANKKRKYLMN